jgi:HEPN domain-containing protein
MSDEVDPAVKDAVMQWLAKADMDWASVEILSENPKGPRPAVCFHCQQYVEKLLKAFLTLHQIEAPRTHDLRRLIQLASPLVAGLDTLCDRADALSLSGIQIRYPDNWRDVPDSEMREMMALADEFAMILLPRLKPGE